MEDNPSKVEVIAKSVEKISDSRGLAAIGEGIGLGVFRSCFFHVYPDVNARI